MASWSKPASRSAIADFFEMLARPERQAQSARLLERGLNTDSELERSLGKLVVEDAPAAAPRTAQEVYTHHAQAMVSGDLDTILSDYAEDAVFITRDGALHGTDGVRQAFTKIFADLPSPEFDVRTRILEGDVLFLEWSAHSVHSHAGDGVETFLVRNGQIVMQSAHYTVQRDS